MRLNRTLSKTLLLLAVSYPAYVLAQAAAPQRLPSAAWWFDLASKAAPVADLQQVPAYQQLLTQEPASSAAADAAIQNLCNSQGKATVACYGATRLALMQTGPVAQEKAQWGGLCANWKAYWTTNAWTALTLRNTVCQREVNILTYNKIVAVAPTAQCVCQ